VVEAGGGLGLPAEALLEGGVRGQVDPQFLHRHVPVEPLVAGFPDRRHAAPAEDVADLVPLAEHPLVGHRIASITVRAMGAAIRPPETSLASTPASWTNTATATLGLSAHATNHA